MIRNFFRKFMMGRYGPDHLNFALIILSLIFNLAGGITRLQLFFVLSYTLIVLAVLRLLSRNIRQRRAENDKFIRYWWPIKTKLGRIVKRIKHRKTHKFFKCQGCRNTLRIPRGKGMLQITCPKCGKQFYKKT